jgi:hypothetical protein
MPSWQYEASHIARTIGVKSIGRCAYQVALGIMCSQNSWSTNWFTFVEHLMCRIMCHTLPSKPFEHIVVQAF